MEGPVFLIFGWDDQYLECLARRELVLEYLKTTWGALGPFKDMGDHYLDGNGRRYELKTVLVKDKV